MSQHEPRPPQAFLEPTMPGERAPGSRCDGPLNVCGAKVEQGAR